MDKHFLTDIEIETFKCFDHFKANGFKRVNLIGGKNNIGKTAFMEACFINIHSEIIESFITALVDVSFCRQQISEFNKNISSRDLLNVINIYIYISKSNLSQYKSFFIKTKDGIKYYEANINNKIITINDNDINIPLVGIKEIAFIDNFGLPDKNLRSSYQEVQIKDKESILNSYLEKFDNSIKSFKMFGDQPYCKKNGEYRKITEFGNGLRQYISIICALYRCENGYLFIDEIDNGIYYTELDRLWEIILTVSKETNCQVFATTHSKEMIDSFARVSEKLEEQDITFTTIIKNRDGKLKALTEDYEMLSYSLSQGHEVR
ncbi:MAG: ATP-binding protein [Methylococcales bacterium]|nr:ATP-binding protein [Methylococcales bacterium]